MAEGASATSFAALIGVARSTISEWASEHPEFSVALTQGKARCAAWWEKVARTNAQTGTGSSTMIVFGLRNMSADDWQEKSETRLSGEVGLREVQRTIVSTNG